MPTPKQRLLYALAGERIDRPPVVCLGGSMSAAVTAVLVGEHLEVPSLYASGESLAQAAIAIARRTGFECLGLPLCTTVEAESFGSTITPGTLHAEPRVGKERYATLAETLALDVEAALDSERVQTLLEAVAIASDEATELPIVVNVLGPFTLAASIVEPTALLRSVVSASSPVRELLAKLRAYLVTLVGRLAAAGADVVAIHEDMGDPRSVGMRVFQNLTVPELELLVSELRGTAPPTATPGHVPLCVCPACRVTTALELKRRSLPIILHGCEVTEPAWQRWVGIGANAVSVGLRTNIESLLAQYPELVVLGNVGTLVLDQGTPEQVLRYARRAVAAGVGALAPECGLAMGTPLVNLEALVRGGLEAEAVESESSGLEEASL